MAEVLVHCTVDNCHYWGEGNKCEATAILITGNTTVTHFPQNVDVNDIGTILETVGETPAKDCLETNCKTFRPN